MKLVLPVQMIRAMDRLIVDGIGGFSTRTEFVREAIDSYLLELTHELAPAEPTVLRRQGRRQLSMAPTVPDRGQPEFFDARTSGGEFGPRLTLEATALEAVPADVAVIDGEAAVVDEPLFGMHNRDYPSLWAARRLLDYAVDGVLPFDEFAERATEEAWVFADALQAVQSERGQKLTALFPTNGEKRQTASSAFRAFAIGSINVRGEQLRAEGPLFLWRVIDVAARDGGVVVGITESGRRLLGRLSGLTVVPPHQPDHARTFIEYLQEHASADWWGFARTLSVVSEAPTRGELIEAFRAARPDWRESVAATNAQGYVARAREWGLIAPKVIDGRYALTELGAELAEGAAA